MVLMSLAGCYPLGADKMPWSEIPLYCRAPEVLKKKIAVPCSLLAVYSAELKRYLAKLSAIKPSNNLSRLVGVLLKGYNAVMLVGS